MSTFHIEHKMQTKAYEYNKLEPENADQVAFQSVELLVESVSDMFRWCTGELQEFLWFFV